MPTVRTGERLALPATTFMEPDQTRGLDVIGSTDFTKRNTCYAVILSTAEFRCQQRGRGHASSQPCCSSSNMVVTKAWSVPPGRRRSWRAGLAPGQNRPHRVPPVIDRRYAVRMQTGTFHPIEARCAAGRTEDSRSVSEPIYTLCKWVLIPIKQIPCGRRRNRFPGLAQNRNSQHRVSPISNRIPKVTEMKMDFDFVRNR